MKSLRRLSAFLFGFLIFTASFTVCLGAKAGFSLTDVNTKENRLFDVTLSAEGYEDVAAFLCELEFDESAVAYRDFTLNVKGAQMHVNSEQKGRIKAVFLCEESVDCLGDSDIVTFSFKALKSGNHSIDFKISELINSASQDLKANSGFCCVSVADIPSPDTHQKPHKTDEKNFFSMAESLQTITSSDEAKAGSTQIGADDNNGEVIVLVILALLLMLGVLVVMYKPIVKKLSKNKDKIKKG